MFTDGFGTPSAIRMMSVISLFASFGFGVVTLKLDGKEDVGLLITSAFLLGAFAPKVPATLAYPELGGRQKRPSRDS